MRAHQALARPRRFALPTFLLGSALSAFVGLALLPTPGADVRGLLVAQGQAAPASTLALGELERDLVPPVVAKPVVKAKPAPKPVVKAVAQRPATLRRASRTRTTVETTSGGGYVCPVAGRNSFTDTWGEPRSSGRRHQGTDVLAAYGTPLVAVTSGVVRTAYSSAGGISLYLRGDDGVEYFYAHNSRNSASSGERVAAGEVIAAVGTSGNAPSGTPHVHFEKHPGGGGAVNPYLFLRRAC